MSKKHELRQQLKFQKRQYEKSELVAIDAAILCATSPYRRIIAFTTQEFEANQFSSSLMNTNNMSEDY